MAMCDPIILDSTTAIVEDLCELVENRTCAQISGASAAAAEPWPWTRAEQPICSIIGCYGVINNSSGGMFAAGAGKRRMRCDQISHAGKEVYGFLSL